MSQEKTFESSLARLEEIVRKLEEGKLSLEESIRIFEEGIRHATFCGKTLDEAERKVEILLKQKDGSFQKKPFEEEGQ